MERQELVNIILEKTRLVAADVAAETERWCWKAIQRGVGYRVWRSKPESVDDKLTYRFAILAPGEDAPGEGIVFGPFGSGDPDADR